MSKKSRKKTVDLEIIADSQYEDIAIEDIIKSFQTALDSQIKTTTELRKLSTKHRLLTRCGK